MRSVFFSIVTVLWEVAFSNYIRCLINFVCALYFDLMNTFVIKLTYMKKVIIAENLAADLGRDKPFKLRENIDILTSTSSDDAIRILSEQKANLIIADYDLPDNDIERLCEGIKNSSGRSKVSILFMGKDDSMDTLHFTVCGAYHYIPKSAPQEKLFKKVRQMLSIPEKKDIRSPIKVTVKGTVMNEYFVCKTLNISPKGLMIETAKVLEKGSVISCSFALSERETISADCKITRMDKKGKRMKRYGLRFQNLGASDRKKIEEFISSEHAAVFA